MWPHYPFIISTYLLAPVRGYNIILSNLKETVEVSSIEWPWSQLNSVLREELISYLVLVHTTPEEFQNAVLVLRFGVPSTLIRHENAALFLRLGLPSTLIRHENGAFRERPSNWRNLKTPALRLSNILKMQLSRKR